MTNVNELRQRIAEIEVPKSFLKSLKMNYGYKPIRKTSIGNLPNAEPGAFERRIRNFNVYEKHWGKTDRRRRLIKTDDGPRVFGAGIASSLGECDFSLSSKPEVIDFDINLIINQEFRIDEMQKKLFILESKTQLYGCLDNLVDKVRN